MSEDRTVDVDERLRQEVARHPYPLVFATISGAHLYGFPSPDSDYDLRGCHVLPAREVVGLDVGPETIESSKDEDGLELDLVTHDARKFFGLMLRKNGYVLEQLYSPLVVHTTPEHEELKAIARGLRHEVPSPPLLRVRRDAVEAVRQGAAPAGQAAALRLPGSPHGHPPDANGRGRGEPRAAQRGGPALARR